MVSATDASAQNRIDLKFSDMLWYNGICNISQAKLSKNENQVILQKCCIKTG